MSCSEKKAKDNPSGGFLNFSFNKEELQKGLKSSDTQNTTPIAAIITVKDQKGGYIFNARRFPLYSIGSGYFTQKIELKTAEYTIEEFLVINADNSVIYLTPKFNSEFGSFVNTPLPLAFNVLENNTIDVILEVLPFSFGKESAYGYNTFSFDVVQTIELKPNSAEGIDAFIEDYPRNGYSDRNFGNHSEILSAGWTTQGISLVVRSLLKFDLSAIPTDLEIYHANLYLYSADNTVNGPGHSTLSGSNELIIQKVTSDWEELTVTWNTQPTTTDIGEIVLPASDSSSQDYTIDMSEMVQEMIANPESNYGFMLKLQNENYYRRTLFASSDNVLSSKHPKLIISYK